MHENVTHRKKRTSIGHRVYAFISIAVFLASFGASFIAYRVHRGQIDTYFKNQSLSNAVNFASFVDGDFLKELHDVVVTDEYMQLRDLAEETDNEELIRDYLKEHGLWERYDETRALLIRYLRNMSDIEYLYIMKLGDAGSNMDVYLIDDDDNPLYVTGSTEEDYLAIDGTTGIVPPTISHSEWGWLCSSYAPVYDSNGDLVCHIGCDINMNDLMASQERALLYDVLGSLIFTVLVTILAIHCTKQALIKPLDKITDNMSRFSPTGDSDYEKSGVIDLKIRNNDEIRDIYLAIQSMQKRIVDYINDIVVIQADKESAEKDVRLKEKEIGKISKDAYRDALTHVGTKIAYTRKTAEMNENLHSESKFALVMVDVNFLKTINDQYGHAAGDSYLSGCCSVICNIYKHSSVFRVGGDEFVVIVTGEDYRNRNKRIRQMHNSFDRSYKRTDTDPWLRYSAAFGMAELSSDDRTIESVYERADKEMYRQKAEFKKSLGLDPEAR